MKFASNIFFISCAIFIAQIPLSLSAPVEKPAAVIDAAMAKGDKQEAVKTHKKKAGKKHRKKHEPASKAACNPEMSNCPV